MLYHVKELQFNARVSKPDPRFASLLLEQFGGANGELKAAMTYFMQAFGAKKAHPDKYDLLMDIATEEFNHLEIVGATIQMLLTGVNGDLKNAAEESEIMALLEGKAAMEDMVHKSFVNAQFFTVSGGGPTLTNSVGVPFSGSYIDANGDLTVDLRSDIAAESRAKIVYEYLMQFTDDPYIKETLQFLMTREVAHFQMFQAALDTIKPNFPPGVLQSDPRYSNLYFNMSADGKTDTRQPWNEGKSPEFGEQWQFVKDPAGLVKETKGLTELEPTGTPRTVEAMKEKDKKMSEIKSKEVNKANPKKDMQWSTY